MRNPRLNYLVKRSKRYLGAFYLKIRNNLRNIILFFILLGLLSLLVINVTDIAHKGDERKKVLLAKRQEVETLKQKNEDLKNQKDFYSSKRYVEEQAKDILGWTYPGEQQLIIEGQNPVIPTSSVKENETLVTKNAEKKENIDKWITLFFD